MFWMVERRSVECGGCMTPLRYGERDTPAK